MKADGICIIEIALHRRIGFNIDPLTDILLLKMPAVDGTEAILVRFVHVIVHKTTGCVSILEHGEIEGGNIFWKIRNICDALEKSVMRLKEQSVPLTRGGIYSISLSSRSISFPGDPTFVISACKTFGFGLRADTLFWLAFFEPFSGGA